jgi:Transposase DDE domain
VRIIEYTVTTVRAGDGTTRTEPFRLVTTLLDHQQAPARELAAAYHQRWEIENSYGELKTRLRGASFILRSRSPELVRQELFGFLAVYQALCALRADAAGSAGIEPDRVCFTVTVRVARYHAVHADSPSAAGQARCRAVCDILADCCHYGAAASAHA